MDVIRKSGEHAMFIVDEADLDTISKATSWFLSWGKDKWYVQGRVQGEQVQIHRYLTKCPADRVVDHVNRDTLDNRRSNLEVTTQSDNLHNRTEDHRNNSGMRGVHYETSTGKWRAKFSYKGKSYSVGRFDSKEEATRNLIKEKQKLGIKV